MNFKTTGEYIVLKDLLNCTNDKYLSILIMLRKLCSFSESTLSRFQQDYLDFLVMSKIFLDECVGGSRFSVKFFWSKHCLSN